MLYKPVYLSGNKMLEAPIPMAPPPPPPEPPQPPPPEPVVERTPTPELPPDPPQQRQQQERTPALPMLISNNGFRHVVPVEKTKDVLTGKVAYLLVDETGVTRFEPKHILNALKLDRERLTKYEDYECIGGHRRLLNERPDPKRKRYKRRYVSMEYIAKGIYGVSNLKIPFKYL